MVPLFLDLWRGRGKGEGRETSKDKRCLQNHVPRDPPLPSSFHHLPTAPSPGSWVFKTWAFGGHFCSKLHVKIWACYVHEPIPHRECKHFVLQTCTKNIFKRKGIKKWREGEGKVANGDEKVHKMRRVHLRIPHREVTMKHYKSGLLKKVFIDSNLLWLICVIFL